MHHLILKARLLAEETRRRERARAPAIIAQLEASGPHAPDSWQARRLAYLRELMTNAPPRIAAAGLRAGLAHAAG